MERLPQIDTHRIRVGATAEHVWSALQALAEGRLARPAPAVFARLWRLDPVSGFSVVEETAPRHIALRGRHRFSRYELAFDIEPCPGGVTLSAHTLAAFPGIAGAAYRALVIGSGGHGVVVRGMLKRIARSAERPDTTHPPTPPTSRSC